MSELFKNGVALIIGGSASIASAIVFVIRWIGEQ